MQDFLPILWMHRSHSCVCASCIPITNWNARRKQGLELQLESVGMMFLMNRGSCYYLLCIVRLLLFFSPTARTDYILRTLVHSYSNPTNRCLGCTPSGRGQGCCDSFQENVQCSGEARCDNVFFSCTRPFGTPRGALISLASLFNTVNSTTEDHAVALQCIQPRDAIRSTTPNTNGAPIDFTGPMFLGLANPIEFEIEANEWEGIQFYLDVLDRDPNDEDEVVESFPINIGADFPRAGRGMTNMISFIGVFVPAGITLSFEVVCQPGFVGETCVPVCSTNPCTNDGTCLETESASGFVCSCQSGFTGETCETMIAITTGNRAITSDSTITTPTVSSTTSTTSTSTSGDTNVSSSVGNVAAVVVPVIGGIGIIAIIVLVVVTVILKLKLSQEKTPLDGNTAPTTDAGGTKLPAAGDVAIYDEVTSPTATGKGEDGVIRLTTNVCYQKPEVITPNPAYGIA